MAACSHGDDLAGLPGGADAGVDASDAGDDGSVGADASVDGGATKPCTSDVDCDDGLACTHDACDPMLGRCRYQPDDALCDNHVFCDGLEVCDAKLGCRAGLPVSCSNNDPCSINTCDEATHECKHTPRDLDGDGDPDEHCGGGDCNDLDAKVSSLHAEVCKNGVDDNCNGVVDEDPCVAPAHETCFDPLMIPGPGTYTFETAGAGLDYGASCGPVGKATSRNVVGLIEIPPGADRRLDVKVQVAQGTAAVALATACGVPTTELVCATSAPSTKGGQVAHARAWDVPPGQGWIVVYTDADTKAITSVDLSEAGAPPTNETCGTAKDLVPGQPETALLVGAAADVATKCTGSTADLVYRVMLTEAHDLHAFASTVDGLGQAIVSIRSEPCSTPDAEVACAQGDPVTAFARNVGPGAVYLVVKATVATDVNLLVQLSPPTPPPADQTCTGAPALTPNVDRAIDLTDHTAAVPVCSPTYADGAYTLKTTEVDDVLVLMRMSQGDGGAISLVSPPCASKTDLIACRNDLPTPTRVAVHGVPAGDYRVVAQLKSSLPATITPFVRPATPPTFVAFSQTCADAFTIPETGGLFQGNTANASAKYAAGCDQGGTGPFGAPEQMLKLVLSQKRRVILDMNGSSYPTLLDVRKGASCPGEEVPVACTIGPGAGRSFLDVTLDAGSYWVQVDGYAGQSGAWLLDVFVAPPATP
jgi:hypothetical protein